MTMVTSALCKSFQQLGITAKGAILARYCSTHTSRVSRNCAMILQKPPIDADRTIYEPNFALTSVRSSILDLNLPWRPVSIGQIHEFPNDTRAIIGEPPKNHRSVEDETVNDKSLDLPSSEKTIEKRAERMIVIRRRKMRRHKLRKLRKRMKFFWGKIKQRREMKKEKAFHAELLAKIRRAENFDASDYVAKRLELLDQVRLPNKYRGVELPEAQIREFLQKDQEKRDKKRNKPRLKL